MNGTHAKRIRRVCTPFHFEKAPRSVWFVAGILILVLTIVGIGAAAGWLGVEVFQHYADQILRSSATR